jgi:hypothetical protein
VTQVVSADALELPEAARFDGDRVFDVPAGDVAAIVAAGTAQPTLWTPDGPVVDLGETREIDRLVFEVDDRPWLTAPAVSASADGRSWTRLAATASLADATWSLYRDPRRGRGQVRFEPIVTRFVRLDPRLPVRKGALEAGS